MKAIILFLSIAGSLVIGGCTTSPSDKQTQAQQDASRERRREDAQRRHEQEERRRAQEDLRRRFARYSTGELKVMHARYSGLAQQSGTRDITVNPLATKIWGTSDRHNIETLIEVERELLRRWQAGDAEAKLPHFESVGTTAGPK